MDENKKTGPYGTVKEWIEILKNIKVLSQKAEEMAKRSDPKWYFSDEGKKAYENASTPAKKTKFFFDYLMSKKNKVIDTEDATKVFFKIALVMANSMDGSSLEFGGYPNILDEDKNPLIKITDLSKDTIKSLAKQPHLLCKLLLAELHEKEISDFGAKAKKSYLLLNYCKDGENYSDIYKIERDIIGLCGGASDPLIPYDNYELSFESDKEADDNTDNEESEDDE